MGGGDCIEGEETAVEGRLVVGRLVLKRTIVVLGRVAELTDGVEGNTPVAEETIGETMVVRDVGIVSVIEVTDDWTGMDADVKLKVLVCTSD